LVGKGQGKKRRVRRTRKENGDLPHHPYFFLKGFKICTRKLLSVRNLDCYYVTATLSFNKNNKYNMKYNKINQKNSIEYTTNMCHTSIYSAIRSLTNAIMSFIKSNILRCDFRRPKLKIKIKKEV
jgi:hypothetical protein